MSTSRLRLCLLQSLLFLVLVPFALHSQESDRVDYSRRARPELEREERSQESEKSLWDRYLQRGPISYENFFFYNSNLVAEGTGQQFPQNESSIAISPLDPNFLISSAVDARDGAWIYISRDGGLSWSNTGLGMVHQNWQTGNDPSVGFDHLGNPYLMYGAFPRPFTGESGVYIAKSADAGNTWTAHIPVIEHVGAMTADSAFEDKYYIEIDRSSSSQYRGWMYTPWKRVTDADSATEIVFTRSTDGGGTWSTPVGISPRKPGTSTHITFGQSFPLVKTGPEGEIYAVWNDGPARSIGFTKSTDGGSTWSSPTYPVSGYQYLGTDRFFTDTTQRIDTLNKGTQNEEYVTVQVIDTTDRYHVLKQTFRAETYPTIAVDVSSSPRRGWVYLCWASDSVPTIHFIRSTDGGATWTTPKSVQSDDRNDQWWPWISVDETNGDIAVMYSDSRNDPENILIDTYVSYSSDGGTTWTDRKATDAMSDFRKNPYVDQIFAGDYSGNSFHDGHIYPSFLDTRNDNDVYTSVISIRQPLPVEDLRVTSTLATLTTANLTWSDPSPESVFGLELENYVVIVKRDGTTIGTVQPGTEAFSDAGLTIDQDYDYDVYVATETDTSVVRHVDFKAGAARLPLAPSVISYDDFGPVATFELKLPGVRADSVSILGNLKAFRIYRNGQLVSERTVSANDTGTVVEVNDNPDRGYYYYQFSLLDGSSPENESLLSDSILVYVGSTNEFAIDFETSPALRYTGTWATTTKIAATGVTSLTDSPNGDYERLSSTETILWPVMMKGAQISFQHIAIVHTSDSAFVEYSIDSGRTWSSLERYTTADYSEWQDRSADEGDWKTEVLTVEFDQSEFIIFRFRLASNFINNADGWYIDDVSVTSFASGVEGTEEASGLSVTISPNPVRDHGRLTVSLEEPGPITLEIYDELGRSISRQSSPSGVADREYRFDFDTSRLASGLYFWRVEGERGRKQGTMVVNN